MRIEPVIDEIDSILERNNADVLVRYVDCDVCDCKKSGVKTVPTLEIHENGASKDRFVGSAGFREYVQFIVRNTGLGEKMFYGNVKSVPGKVVRLKELDFEDGFSGPWIVLFYSNQDEETRQVLAKLAETYRNKISFGEMDTKRSERVRVRVNIADGPTVLGMYKGIFVTYTGKRDTDGLGDFAEKLIEPSFQPIDIARFKREVEGQRQGTPVFIVFYSDLSLANDYFKQIAHEYKFRARIYKTNDEFLFKKAGVWPKTPTEKDSHVLDEDKVILTVYKDKVFHRCPYKLHDFRRIADWIFQSHFPHLIRITTENFASVFYGLKPVLLLLTRNEEFVADLERVSAAQHLGMPYTDYLFGTIDLDTFPLFMTRLLPKLHQPVMVVYDPLKQLFHYKNMVLSSIGFEDTAISLLKDFEKGRLSTYPTTRHTVVWQPLTPMEESEAKDQVQYQCMDCYETVDVGDKSTIRCNNCGYRIFTKRRSKKPLQFEAR
ncbi:UNVERIFIED_CONTAM: hypothetical protein PYX00_011723 [Menopon gallinae]|uniref:Thioredoxin domain-containing protein n=1 Tax=Menopon gallinae TaxID=328185 RepID=A0AAW2H8G0_9NEOP